MFCKMKFEWKEDSLSGCKYSVRIQGRRLKMDVKGRDGGETSEDTSWVGEGFR